MQVFQVISHRKTCAKELGQPRGLLTALGQRHKGLSCGPTFLAMSPTEMHPQVQRSPTPAALVLRLGNAQHSLRWAGEGVMGRPIWARPGRHTPSHRRQPCTPDVRHLLCKVHPKPCSVLQRASGTLWGQLGCQGLWGW